MKKISVIVPLYNAEKYLDRCIGSIVSQTYPQMEILLIDDGSNDNSAAICDRWSLQDERIRVIHQENRGISGARNRGLQEITGDLLIMVDSDDYISRDMLSCMEDIMNKTGADLVLCDFEEGKDNTYQFEISGNRAEVITGTEALSRIYGNGHDMLRFVAPWGKLYRKELFKGIQYPAGRIFEDIYVTHRILCKCRSIAVTDQKLLYYYRHCDSIMHEEFHIGKLDYLDALEDRILFFREKQLYQLEQTAMDEYLHSLIWEYSRVRDILQDQKAMKEIAGRFRRWYRIGYASRRYPKETAAFLTGFSINPELIIMYWRIKGVIRKIHGCKKKTD